MGDGNVAQKYVEQKNSLADSLRILLHVLYLIIHANLLSKFKSRLAKQG